MESIPPTDEDLKKLAAEAADRRLKGLTDEAERGARDIHVADHMPIKRFFYAAKTILQQARTLAGEQDLERAYVLLIRFSTLFVEVLPTHAGFKTAEVADDRKALIKEVSKVLEEATLVKSVLRSRYLVDDEARIRAEVELQQQAAAEAKAAAEAQAAAKAAAEAAAANAARAAAAAAEARRVAEAEAKAKAKAAAEAAEVAAALAAVEEFEKRDSSPGIVAMAKTKKMATDDADDGYSYGPALATSTKKKRLVKLSRKQLKRKQMKRERGENKELMRGNKAQRDFVRRERKDVARTSW